MATQKQTSTHDHAGYDFDAKKFMAMSQGRGKAIHLETVDARLLCAGCHERFQATQNTAAELYGSLHGLLVVYRNHEEPAPKAPVAAPAGESKRAPALPESAGAVLAINPWHVACVDIHGWLEELDETRNPWHTGECDQSHCTLGHRHYPKGNVIFLNTTYDMYFVRHPNPAFAFGLCRHLNALATEQPGEKAPASDAKAPSLGLLDFSAYPSQVGPHEVSFKLTELKTGDKSAVALLPEDPSYFVPQGHANYNGYTLYSLMPHRHCPTVKEAVARLQHHLGALRYPVGGIAAPYEPQPDSLGVFDRQLLSVVVRFQHHLARGRGFLLASPKHTLYELLHSEAPFERRPAPPPVVAGGPRQSWRFAVGVALMDKVGGGLCGVNDKTFKAALEDAKTPNPPGADLIEKVEVDQDGIKRHLETVRGAIDQFTGRGLEFWLTKGIRKAGRVLVEVTKADHPAAGTALNEKSLTWLREEAAVRLELWRVLVDLMGCPHGVVLASTLRDLETGRTKRGKGMSKASIHKTGLALDLAVVGQAGLPATLGKDEIVDFATPADHWPVWFECHRARFKQVEELREVLFHKEQQWSQAQAEVSKLEAEHKPVPAHQRARLLHLFAEREVYRGLLAQATSEPGPKGAKVCSVRWRIYGRSTHALTNDAMMLVWHRLEQSHVALRQRLRPWLAVDDDDFASSKEVWLGSCDKLAQAAAKSIAKGTPTPLAPSFYRASIRPFVYEGYSFHGGHDDPELLPNDSTRARLRLKGPPLLPPSPAEAEQFHSWLNLTAVAHACGLFRIGSAADGFRPPLIDDAYDEVPLAGMAMRPEERTRGVLEVVHRLLERVWSPSSVSRNQPIWVVREDFSLRVGKGKPDSFGTAFPRYLRDYDLNFMHQWAEAFDQESHWKGYLLPGYARQLREGSQKLKREPLASKRFLLDKTGAIAKRVLPDVDTLKLGREWAELLEAASKSYPEQAKAYRREQSELRKRQKAAGDVAPARPKQELRDDAFVLQPVFERDLSRHTARAAINLDFDNPTDTPLETSEANEVTLRRNDVVYFPAMGCGRTLEWWHYQAEAVKAKAGESKHERPLDLEDPEEDFTPPLPARKTARQRAKGNGAAGPGGLSFGKLMGEAGHSMAVLGELCTAPRNPGAARNHLFVGGYGYDVATCDGNARGEAVENDFIEPVPN